MRLIKVITTLLLVVTTGISISVATCAYAASNKSSSSSASVDTTDLSSWYVYDHYNTEYWNDPDNWPAGAQCKEDAWMMYYGKASTTDISRPAAFVSDKDATGSAYSAVEYMLAAGTGLEIAQRMREHIYSYIEAGSPAMWFAGYGSSSRADFLFYPAASTGYKNVQFTVDSRYVNTHCLNGAGFLLNTGVDPDGFIHGYILYYKFTSADSVSSVVLYKLKNKVLAENLHDDSNYFTNLPDRLAQYCTIVKKVINPTWSPVMNIEIGISPTAISVKQGTSSNSMSTVMNSVAVNDSGYNGFGPFVQYTGEEHTCNKSSAFKFSNLQMFYERTSSWANAEVKNAVSEGLVPDSLLKKDLTRPITREEFCELAVLLYEKSSGITVQQDLFNPFTDTENPQVQKAYMLHIVHGTSATTFSPDTLITREQCATMLFNVILIYAPWLDAAVIDIPDFCDQNDISEYAVKAMKYLYYLGIIKGDSNGNIMPKGTTNSKTAANYGLATREAAIMMVLRTYKNNVL